MVQALKLLAGCLSSLLLTVMVAVAAIFPEHPGSQEHLRILFSTLMSGAIGCQPTAGLHPSLPKSVRSIPPHSRGKGLPTSPMSTGNTFTLHFSSPGFKSHWICAGCFLYLPCISLIHLKDGSDDFRKQSALWF